MELTFYYDYDTVNPLDYGAEEVFEGHFNAVPSMVMDWFKKHTEVDEDDAIYFEDELCEGLETLRIMDGYKDGEYERQDFSSPEDNWKIVIKNS